MSDQLGQLLIAVALALTLSSLIAVFVRYLRSREGRASAKPGDFLYPWILGVLELAAYPVLIRRDMYEGIAAWLVLKTVAQWRGWEDRRTYNRFLIGNGFVLIFAWFIGRGL